MSPNAELRVAREGRVLRILIDRLDKHNALSRDVLAGLKAALDGHDADDIACVVLSGAGTRYFAAGGDLRDLASVRNEVDTRAMATEARAALDAVRNFPVPVLAVLNGDAIGGGAELAVACDLRLMSEGARIGFIHGKLNITSAWGGGPDLVSLIGPARALYMTTSCALVPAQTALAWGLADAVAPAGNLDEAIAQFIEPMLRQTSLALRACKAQARAYRRGASYGERREIEQDNLVATWTHADHWAAVERVLPPKKKAE